MAPTQGTDRRITLLTLVALVAMVGAYFMPIWWVSLTAPNYPKDAFPQGIRIHFHFDQVTNGCHVAGSGSRRQNEVLQQDMDGAVERYNAVTDSAKDLNRGAQGLDCVHEMNTINHYVGMFPISTGAPVEKPLSRYFFGAFAAMLLAFMVPERQRGRRAPVLAAGFTAVAAWMLVDQYALGSLDAHVHEYVQAATSYFNEPGKIMHWGENVRLATHWTIGGLLLGMLVLVLVVWRRPRASLLLAIVPAFLPLYFIITYAGWLWFFGHNLHPWGAFTVKPFMPTVFGEGKVAQFSTYSYPYWGFAALLVVFATLGLATLQRQRQIAAGDGG